MQNKRFDAKRLSAITRRVQIRNVSCRALEAKRHLALDALPACMELNSEHDAFASRDESRNELVVLVNFRLRITAAPCDGEEKSGEAPSECASIAATLALRYEMLDIELAQVPADDLQVFAEVNGVYNAWPYWRELVQSTGSRIGLHGIVAPVFRVESTTPEESKE